MTYTNLSDLLKGICDAIRDKKGTTGVIKHQDIPSEIASIKTQSQDVLSLASGITSYTESFTIDGEERPNVLVQPSDFSDASKVTLGDEHNSYLTYNIQNIVGAENEVAAVIAPGNTTTNSYKHVFWFDVDAPDSSETKSKTYLIALRAKASIAPTSYFPQMAITYYASGTTSGSKFLYFTYKPTTEWNIFYVIANIPENNYLKDITMCFTNQRITHYIDWVTAYDITGTSFANMTFGARATASSVDVRSGKYFYRDGILYGGSMTTVEKPSPTITVDSTGLVSANYTMSSGYVASGTASNTHYLSSSDDSDFVASNIKSGVSIFGVTGSYSGGKTYVGETYGTFPEADVCYGWADGSYDYLVTSSNVIYVPIDSTHVNVVPTSVSIIRRNEGTNGLIAALYKGSSKGSGLRMIADDSDEFAIGREGTGYFEFYWYGNNLLINIDEAILNSERYWYAVSYS
jgi:hypothetical protein